MLSSPFFSLPQVHAVPQLALLTHSDNGIMSSERQVPAEDASLIMPRHLGAGEEAKGPGGWRMTHQQDHPIPLSASSLPVTHCSGSLGKVSPKEQQQRPPYLPSVLGFPFPPWPLLFILCYFLRPAVLCLSRGILGSVGKDSTGLCPEEELGLVSLYLAL